MRTETVLPFQSMSCQRLDDVLARLLLVVGRNSVFKIEEDHVSGALGRLLEKLGRAARNRKFAAIEARRRLLDDREAHRLCPLVGCWPDGRPGIPLRLDDSKASAPLQHFGKAFYNAEY